MKAAQDCLGLMMEKFFDLDFEGWLCRALLKYFSTPPREIYVKVEELKR